MAKKTGLSDTLTLGKKKINTLKSQPAKDIVEVEKVEKAIDKIHDKNVRVSVDVPKDLYKKLKIRTANDGITNRDYILSLMRGDLNTQR